MRGKDKCRILKEIRRRIAEENGIETATRECTYQGECSGTCPKCEQELRDLELQLEKRRQLGKTIAVAALATGLLVGATGCPATGTGIGEKTETVIAEETTAPPEVETTEGLIPAEPTKGMIPEGPTKGEIADPTTATTELPGRVEDPTQTPTTTADAVSVGEFVYPGN